MVLPDYTRSATTSSTRHAYGAVRCFHLRNSGAAAANLMDGVMLRRLHQGLVPPSLRPEDHSPLEGYAKSRHRKLCASLITPATRPCGGGMGMPPSPAAPS